MRFPFFRNRDSVKNGILISIRRTGDGFHPGLFIIDIPLKVNTSILLEITFNIKDSSFSLQISDFLLHVLEHVYSFWYDSLYHINKWRIT